MSFVVNNNSQISFDDSFGQLTKREQKFLEKSWAKHFAEKVFPAIDEEMFSCLYSSGAASRPNTPVNVIVGALLIKELFGMTDDELVEGLMFDVRFQYALHTTSFKEQPLSDRTLSRFRERCLSYSVLTGKDLIHDVIIGLSKKIEEVMNINSSIKRMDSLMIASNIKRLSRLELLYTCVANFVKYINKNNDINAIDHMKHYLKESDYNEVIYHSRDIDVEDRIKVILEDAVELISKYEGSCDDSSEYQLLVRVLKEQTVRDENGLRLRRKEDGTMDSTILQNPSDPEATYRRKAGKDYIGYVGNVKEVVDKEKKLSLIEDYRFENNTYSDSKFINDEIEGNNNTKEETIITDGSYGGVENIALAEQKNIKLVATDLIGRETKEINKDFEMNEDGTEVLKCPMGYTPKKCGYNKETEQCRVSFTREQCENCPHRKECGPKITKRTGVIIISKKSQERAKIKAQMKSEEYKEYGRIRNGVEAIPSLLRRKYKVDKIPVRGKNRMRIWFGFKIGAINLKRLIAYEVSLIKVAQKEKCA